jgi:hypothetical protein
MKLSLETLLDIIEHLLSLRIESSELKVVYESIANIQVFEGFDKSE